MDYLPFDLWSLSRSMRRKIQRQRAGEQNEQRGERQIEPLHQKTKGDNRYGGSHPRQKRPFIGRMIAEILDHVSLLPGMALRRQIGGFPRNRSKAGIGAILRLQISLILT